MLSLALVISSLVTLSLVSPAKADDSTPCGIAVGKNASTWNAKDFTLVAVGKSDNTDQNLLVLDWVPTFGSDLLLAGGINASAWIVTNASSAHFLFETHFQMINGSIFLGSGGNGTSNNPLQENGPLTFNTRPETPPLQGNQQYCIMFNEPNTLAVNYAVTDDFWLCNLNDDDPQGHQVIVVYNANSTSPAYESGTCKQVDIVLNMT